MNYSQLALELMDLTSLNDDDSNDTIITLCEQAKTPFGHPAAVCVYPAFIEVAQHTLKQQGLKEMKVATVTNFPTGAADVKLAVSETQQAVALGADEVDVVFPYEALMNGDHAIGIDLVRECKAACDGQAALKVIIESGVLDTEALIRLASEQAITGGADFIKTSTGKVDVNATLPAAKVMLNVIKDSGRKDIGFKAAGGVRTAADAKAYLKLAADIMGEDWISADTFRFGASSLLGNLLAALNNKDESLHSGY